MPNILKPISIVALCLTAVLPAVAADKFPARPIRLIIPSGAGGITDILGRTIAPKLSDALGQQVVIDNRPGASGIVGSQIVAKSAPDGYTLLMVFPSHVVNQSLFPDMPYDTATAFAPITLVSAVSPVLIVNSQFPARSVAEFIALAKAKPGQLNHGSTGAGSMGSLGADLFGAMAGIKFTQVVYKGAPQALTALLSGEIEFYLVGSVSTAVQQVKAGRARALGVGAKQRNASLPDVPPIADTLPGYEARGWNGILAPAGTPKPIIERLHQALVKIIRSPDMAPALVGEGATAVGNTPAEFDAIIRADIVKWAKIIKDANSRAR
ncbi:MAG TPA: tripartite tricarboxylate transporter substrate binding protein [Burkholderiales bacterium]|nr:tripartite tricarboxylate transporter substrate binding protein [Burkholderiales bacterium]